MTTKSTKLAFRNGDTMVETEVTTTTTPATIDYLDILDSCEIVPDEDCGAPWDNCDGLEHETTPAQRFDHDASDMRGYCHNDRQSIVVTVDREQVRKWGVYDHARANGASRQVAREMEALNLRQTIERIAKIYEQGIEGYGITCDYLGEHDSCWGYDDEEYACHSAIHDIAGNVAHALEQRGYTVVNKPDTTKTKYGARWNTRRKLLSQSFVENEPFNYAAAEREMIVNHSGLGAGVSA